MAQASSVSLCHCKQTQSQADEIPDIVVKQCQDVIHLKVQSRDVKFVSFPNSNFVCKIRILFELRLGPMTLTVRQSYAYSTLYNMAFMRWCSILGPGRILLL